MTKQRAMVSRDGAPSVGEALAAQETALHATAVVSAATALDWARVNKIKLPARGRCAAINQARLAADLPPFKIDLRLTDRALPILEGRRGAIVIERERPKRRGAAVPDSRMSTVLQKALLAWWSAHNQGSADERTATTAYLREALEPHIADLQAAVVQL